MRIPFTKSTLANGLDVIVHEDRHCPIVAVNVWYHVGSKNEVPGRTGFAHLFEHLMFEGSAHYDRGYIQALQDAGASLNGSTNTDRTNYWEIVPTNALELALWLESDRMGYLLPALTEAKFANQRDVVLNERRQNYENRPYGLAALALVDALFPPEHPYHWPTIGSPADVRDAQLDQVADFFRTYYHPANASLCIAGDVDTDAALALAHDYFEELPAGPRPSSLEADPRLDAERRLVLEDRIEMPRLYMGWHSPALFADRDAHLDVLADILANGKTSRLYRTIVYERRIATDVSAAQNSRELSSFFLIAATAAPGVTLAELETAIDLEIENVSRHGATEQELQRSLAVAEAHFVYRLQGVGGFGGKSDQLNAYNVLLRDPGSFDRDLDRYLRSRVDDIQAAAAAVLRPDARVVLSVVPSGRPDLAAPRSERVVMA
jgi:zinc protease